MSSNFSRTIGPVRDNLYMPRVSVILAVHNGERYLSEAIESILHQSHSNFEFLIVNDGSVDATRNIILSNGDSRIRLIDNAERLGLPRSLNRALATATGEYIARQDADDVSESDRLARQVAFLDRNPRMALLGTWFTVVDSNGAVVRHASLPVDDFDLRWAMFFSNPFVHSSMM